LPHDEALDVPEDHLAAVVDAVKGIRRD